MIVSESHLMPAIFGDEFADKFLGGDIGPRIQERWFIRVQIRIHEVIPGRRHGRSDDSFIPFVVEDGIFRSVYVYLVPGVLNFVQMFDNIGVVC